MPRLLHFFHLWRKIIDLEEKAWIGLIAVTVLLIVGARYLPYFPGDLAVARFVQWITPASTGWAEWISSTAKFPLNLVLLTLTIGFSWWLAGRHAALLAMVSFAGMWVLGIGLGPLLARPRPSPDLIHVAGNLSGYSFPSIFGLTYASTIGYLGLLLTRKASGILRRTAVIACGLSLLVGWAARIALGAHWPSDVIMSYLIGFLWAYFLIRFVYRKFAGNARIP
ncbi:MAG: phosphatase PAP2 family protein [Deltaproteobacteria bacterium]|nr:phosphatase PAP2 family protein [Deltaproteobacteria bacterium]